MVETPVHERRFLAAPDAAARARRNGLLGVTVVAGIVLVTVIGLLTVPSGGWAATDLRSSRALFDWGHDNPPLVPLSTVIGDVTLPTVLRVVTLVAAILLWRRGHRFAAVWWVVTVVAVGMVAIAVRYAVARPRPVWSPPVTGYTFPSGHAAQAAGFAICVVVVLGPFLRRLARWLLGVAALLLALLVGTSRVVLGVHHVGDVLAAWATAGATVAVLALLAGLPAVRSRLPDALQVDGRRR